MGSRFKKTVISENVRKSLSKWQRRVKEKQSSAYEILNTSTTTSLESLMHGMDNYTSALIRETQEGSSSRTKDVCFSNIDDVTMIHSNAEFSSYDEDHHDHDVKYDLSSSLSWDCFACTVESMIDELNWNIYVSSYTGL